jgi:hypothetical protein
VKKPRAPTVQAVRDTGYLDQLKRARRFRERMKTANQSGEEFHDMAWAFFQNCWHVKEWVRNDRAQPKAKRDAVKKEAEQSTVLTICQDLCNGTKHLMLEPRSGSGALEKNIGYTMYTDDRPNEIDCVVEDGRGGTISGRPMTASLSGSASCNRRACLRERASR